MLDFARTKLGLIKQTFSEFSEDDCPMMAAALAYYTAFSLPPLMVLIVTVAGWLWSPEAVVGQVETQVTNVVGEGGWTQIEEMMHAAGEEKQGIVAALIGIVALLFGATGVMGQLQVALNRTWEVQPDPDQGGVQNFIVKRILSFAMVIAVAFLLLVSLVLTAVLHAVGGMVTYWLPSGISSGLPISDWIPPTINFVVSLVIFTLLFAAMFKWLPDAEIRWKDIWVGAAATSVMFMIGEFALGLYFSMTDRGTYGAAASFVLLLLWAYYSALIFLLGAEFTQVWARRKGTSGAPSEGAVRAVCEKRLEHDPAVEPPATSSTSLKS